jgi:hypothetical protein
VLLAIALVLLLALAWTGISGGFNQLSESHTTGEMAQTITQFAYGLSALLSVVTAFRGRRWAPAIHACWVVSVSLSAGLASVVWGGTPVATGVLSAGAAMLVALAITWLLRVGARGPTTKRSPAT